MLRQVFMSGFEAQMATCFYGKVGPVIKDVPYSSSDASRCSQV